MHLRHLTPLLIALSIASCKDATVTAPQPAHTDTVSLGSKSDADRIAASAYTHTATILDFGHRQPESAGLAKAKNYITSQLKGSGWHCVEQSFTATTPKGPIKYSNLIARYAPNPDQNPWKRNATGVIGSHIDSKILPNFLGADDAASCAATMLALAEHLHASHPAVAKQLELVFFDGEEAIGPNMSFNRDGLYGSIHYSRAVQANSAQGLSPYKKTPKFGIVLDMIGHENLDIKIPSDTPRSLVRSYDSARNKLSLKNHFKKSNSSILDDHYPMNEIARIPTIDLIGDFKKNTWWHTSDDSIDIISKSSLSMSIQMTLEILSNQL